jgi:hypothetical protein
VLLEKSAAFFHALKIKNTAAVFLALDIQGLFFIFKKAVAVTLVYQRFLRLAKIPLRI